MEKRVRIVDQTIRDAQQSLWGFLMSTEMITPIAATMDDVGYKAIATNGSNGFVVQSRYYNEDPWERIRLLSRAMPRTPLRGSYMTASLASFDIDTPRDAIALWIRRSVAHGVKGFWVCDYQADMERFHYFAQVAKECGAEVVASLMYTSSPAHDDAHWARKVKLIAGIRDVVDAIMIEDASGVLTPELTRHFLSTVVANCDSIPLEFHMHCNSGLAPLCYMEALKAGVDTLHTAVAPLANGTSLPSTESVVRNARRLGYAADLDEKALETVSAHFRRIAEERGFPIGTPEEYDLFHYEHQVPGGMRTNLERQLREMKMLHRMEEVLAEVVLVRRELGFPVMATPFSQIVGVQAVENVLSGERYKRVPDTVIKYIMGFYGEPAGPVDGNVRERVLSLPEAVKLKEWQPRNRFKPLEELRREVGPELNDDELLLKLLIPGHGAKGARPKSLQVVKPAAKAPPPAAGLDFPMAFSVEVDGEVFGVRITPADLEEEDCGAPSEQPARRRGKVDGAIPSGMSGMVVAVKVNRGDSLEKGAVVATIEAMKMIMEVCAPHSGTVEEIFVSDGEMVEPEDLLMVVRAA